MRWTPWGPPDEWLTWRTAKSCGPDPPTLGSSFAGRFAERRWLSSPVHRGERGAAVNTIARGMPVVPAEPVLLACVMRTLFCTQGSRVRPASGIPCALLIFEGDDDASLGQFMPRECG